MDEKPYSLPKICTRIRLSVRRARRLFEHEPGVLLFKPPGYAFPDIQVPKEVLIRVLQRSAVPGPVGSTQQQWAELLEGNHEVHKIPELGRRFNIGESKARRQFEDEPGVLHLFAPGDERPAIRVPGWVLQRVLRRSAVPVPVKSR
jgi:hypothetical protein